MALSKLWKRLSFQGLSKGKSGNTKVPLLPGELCRHFSLDEVKTLTQNFNEKFHVAESYFSRLYEGFLDESNISIHVAIKRLELNCYLAAEEFEKEILLLCQISYHTHLVPFIGYCNDKGERILVHEFMANDTLRHHLYDTDNPPLDWKKRLKICIGVAQGLHYLHSGLKHPIIHGDVKTTNILLDEKWVAKVTDSGFCNQIVNRSKSSNSVVDRTRGSLNFGLSEQILNDTQFGNFAGDLDNDGVVPLRGTIGYIDPDFVLSSRLTEKSDVYSLGVVLFEVLCARQALNPSLQEEESLLSQWALTCLERGTIGEIIDPHLMGKITPECFNAYVEVAASCVYRPHIQRPRMVDVIEKLELALELQENADAQRVVSPGTEDRYPKVLSFPFESFDSTTINHLYDRYHYELE